MIKRKQQKQERDNPAQARLESFPNSPAVKVPKHLRKTDPQPGTVLTSSGIRDNYTRGTVNTFANLGFWPFLPKMRFEKSNKINGLRFD